MGIANILEPLNESVAARLGDFRAIGQPGLYETNESTTAGFYEDLRSRFRPDGYVYGPGCGNVLSMVEAFEDRPRGLVMVDLDPAVTLASRILVGVLERQSTAAGWAEELFCGGREGACCLVDRALEAESSASLRWYMEQHTERFLEGLAPWTDDFELEPKDVPELLERWASYHPPRGRPVPVRTFLVRNYDRLRAMALDGDIAVLLGSLLDSDLLDAVSKLPDIGERTSLVYLSNIADHFRRRALRLDALSRLKLAPNPESGDFLTYLNDQQLSRLRQLTRAADNVVSVRSMGIGSLTLEADQGIPRYTAKDFGPTVELGRIVPRFLTRLTDTGSRSEAPEDPRRFRAMALNLYSAGVAGEPSAVQACMDTLKHEVTRLVESPASSELIQETSWLAETIGPLMLLGRDGSLPEEPDLSRNLAVLAERITKAPDSLRARVEVQPPDALRWSQALEGTAELLARTDFQRIGRRWRDTAIAATDPQILSMADLAEMLLRATWIAAMTRDSELLETARPLALGILRSLTSGAITEQLATSRGASRTLSEDLRLGLLFFGLLAENVQALEGALCLDYLVRYPEDATLPEPEAILASLARESMDEVA